jgi:hypothetical protein
MSVTEQTKLAVEVWKTIVQVQQHFNDIEMRIRALAITVLTAGVGVAAVAIKDGTTLGLLGLTVRLGAALLLITLLAWILFYMVDQIWYHRLLLGAVRQGEAVENALEKDVPGIGLTKAISANSPYQVTAFGQKIGTPIHTAAKLKGFYWGVGVLLLVLAFLAQLGGLGMASPSLLRVSTSKSTFCGPIVSSQSGVITIDDQFRHSKQSLRTRDVQTESITQDCTK